MNADKDDRAGNLERYVEHANRLQTWLGAYAAGLATVLIVHYREVTNHEPTASDGAALACALWAIGAALAAQVALLIVNKYTQFYAAHPTDPPSRASCIERACNRIADWVWIDALLDAVSIVALAAATIRGLHALGLDV